VQDTSASARTGAPSDRIGPRYVVNPSEHRVSRRPEHSDLRAQVDDAHDLAEQRPARRRPGALAARIPLSTLVLLITIASSHDHLTTARPSPLVAAQARHVLAPHYLHVGRNRQQQRRAREQRRRARNHANNLSRATSSIGLNGYACIIVFLYDVQLSPASLVRELRCRRPPRAPLRCPAALDPAVLQVFRLHACDLPLVTFYKRHGSNDESDLQQRFSLLLPTSALRRSS
jgi:hypothetical protein